MVQSNAAMPHITALDGFRGGLALWVYLGHLAAGVGYSNYILGLHALAVDVFMVLSGYLMVYTWPDEFAKIRGVNTRKLSAFYLGRFFRIAPLYYALLFACYVFLPQLNQMYDYQRQLIPPIWAQGLVDYAPKIGWDFGSFRWLYLHASFAFGAVPGMEASTPLPDWSLSLEMQFYLFFPFFLLLCLKRGSLMALAGVAAVLAIASPSLFGSYLTPGSLAHFGQPSLLSYRLNAFLAGMVVAYWVRIGATKQSTLTKIVVLGAAAICLLPLSKPVILIYLIFVGLALQKLSPLARLLSLKPFKLLGEISYSVYLSHLLVLIPFTYWLIQWPEFMSLNSTQRFGLALALTSPVVILFSYGLYVLVEKPSIRLGSLVRRKWFLR